MLSDNRVSPPRWWRCVVTYDDADTLFAELDELARQHLTR